MVRCGRTWRFGRRIRRGEEKLRSKNLKRPGGNDLDRRVWFLFQSAALSEIAPLDWRRTEGKEKAEEIQERVKRRSSKGWLQDRRDGQTPTGGLIKKKTRREKKDSSRPIPV